jgi:predicted nucleotidyltransferase
MKMMTQFKDVNELLKTLVSKASSILDTDLIGIYVYGSLIWGDFNREHSDVDVMIAIRREMNAEQFKSLEGMHNELIVQFPAWNDRIEIAYVPIYLLKHFKHSTGKIAVISPGEPFNIKEAGKDWLINYYLIQNNSITLYGPKPKDIIEPISKIEFIHNVKEQAIEWKEWVGHTKDSIGYQYYAVLTICRAYYVLNIGKQPSKMVAGKWMLEKFPKWHDLIESALSFHDGVHIINPQEAHANYTKVYNFVTEIIDLIQKNYGEY